MYQLPNLPYLLQDLEPFIDIHTMGLHYFKHHTNYLNKLNELLQKSNYDYKFGLNELVFHIDELKEDYRKDILFNLGGVLNHNLYWKSINPKLKEKPSGKFKDEFIKTYGSIEKFWEQFKKKALELKGSGYTFLIINKTGQLDIINLSNQETPLTYGNIPLFNIDLWEHAYYLNYENDKAKYIDNFEKIADFSYASVVYNNLVK